MRAARAGLGTDRDSSGADLVAPPALASVRAYADLAALDQGMETRGAYRRYGPETVVRLEEEIAALEAVDDASLPLARATSSGQAALLLTVALLVSPRRRRVVVVRPCYGSSDALIAGPLGGLGVQLTTVDLPSPGDADQAALIAAVLDGDVAAVVAEVITNPLMGVVDIPAIASVSHDAGAALVVDSTLATPFLFQPFAHGADVVYHSLTKHLSGHSDVLGGILLVRPDIEAADWLDGYARLMGVGLGPFDAWLALRGLRTAALRVERGSENAAALAKWLREAPGVGAVHYPGSRGGDDEERAARLLPDGRGPMLSFELEGGRDAAAAFVEHLEGVRLAPSLGDVATTISHPALSSHRSLSREQRAALGIGDGLLRVSTGIEPLESLRAEFAAALGGRM
ncbi:MAG TPA: PLP-dependent aspartate aminotransferase family protein [Candidatus Dormibacteraeota bacterium]|nr:PLP-dependent aspartate aminotransferase family protein [Candidatus Dormibacteraeota bacterium]